MPEDQLTAREAARRFPTGVNLVYYPENLADAGQVWRRYLGVEAHG